MNKTYATPKAAQAAVEKLVAANRAARRAAVQYFIEANDAGRFVITGVRNRPAKAKKA